MIREGVPNFEKPPYLVIFPNRLSALKTSRVIILDETHHFWIAVWGFNTVLAVLAHARMCCECPAFVRRHAVGSPGESLMTAVASGQSFHVNRDH